MASRRASRNLSYSASIAVVNALLNEIMCIMIASIRSNWLVIQAMPS